MSLPQEFEDRGDLAAAHDDSGLDAQGREPGLKDAVLDGILIVQDQGLPVQHRQLNLGGAFQRMAFTDAKIERLREEKPCLELVDVGDLHIDQGNVEHVILDQLAGPHRAVFLQFQPDIRMFFVEGIEKFREEECAEHGRDSETDSGLGGAGGGVICLKVLTVRENGGGPVVKALAFLGEGNLGAGVGEKSEGEFFLQIPDRDGNSGLRDKERFGSLRDAMVARGSAKISELG